MRQIVNKGSRRPRGFTLTELLVVIVIILVLAGITIPTAMQLAAGSQLREAANLLQTTIAGARDRAMVRQEPIGVRLLRDSNETSIVRELQYIRTAAPLNAGTALVMHHTWPNTVPAATLVDARFDRVVLLGEDPIRIKQLPSVTLSGTTYRYGSIRLGKAGPFLSFTTTDALIDQTVSDGMDTIATPILELSRFDTDTMGNTIRVFEPFTMPAPFGTDADLTGTSTDARAIAWRPSSWGSLGDTTAERSERRNRLGLEFDIPLGNVPLEGNEPIKLPNGIVIDLGYIPLDPNAPLDLPDFRLTRLRPTTSGQWDILLSPQGQVIGDAAAESQIALWVRESLAGVETVACNLTNSKLQKVVTSTGTGRHLIVGVFSRGGFVAVADPNFVDQVRTLDGSSGADGYFDQGNYYDNLLLGNNSGL